MLTWCTKYAKISHVVAACRKCMQRSARREARACAHARTHAHTHAHTQTHTHARTRAHARARAHTHTHKGCADGPQAEVDELGVSFGAPPGTTCQDGKATGFCSVDVVAALCPKTCGKCTDATSTQRCMQKCTRKMHAEKCAQRSACMCSRTTDPIDNRPIRLYTRRVMDPSNYRPVRI